MCKSILRNVDSLIQQIYTELQPMDLFSVYVQSFYKHLLTLLGARHWTALVLSCVIFIHL